MKIGVYVCHCGSNIAGSVDVEDVARFAATLDHVVVSRDYKYSCSDPGQEMIMSDIKEHGLDRVVVAACSPRMHEPTFRRTLEAAGLNPYLLSVANIREACSWIHEGRRPEATEKAKASVAAAVRRAVKQCQLFPSEVPVRKVAMVVGGGVAGIQAALDIAGSGFRVILVEKEPTIGGHMAMLDKTFPTLDCSACILTPKMVDVARHPNIELLSYTEVEKVEGYVGNFDVTIRKKSRYVDIQKCTGCGSCVEVCRMKDRVPHEFEQGMGKRGAIYIPFPQAVPLRAVIDPKKCIQLTKGKCKGNPCVAACGDRQAIDFQMKDELVTRQVGTIVLATGFKLFDARKVPQYGYGRYDDVLDGLQFERLCNASGPTGGKIVKKNGQVPKSVAFIHCVGSRDKLTNEHCSRVCCMYAMKLAHLAEEKTHGKVYCFYIDIRAFGKGYEEFYNRIQGEGVQFIRGKVAEVYPENGKLVVCGEDANLGRKIEVPVEMVVLCAGLTPQPDAQEVQRKFHISRSKDGFFLEAHPKLRPVATNTDGIFLAGACQGPKDIPDSVAQASGAAAQAILMMAQGKVVVEPITAEVIEERCTGCADCLKACPYEAIELREDGKAWINPALCKGCGTCAGTCLPTAIRTNHFTNEQLIQEMLGEIRMAAR